VSALEYNPALTRTCLVEMSAAGPRARKLKLQIRDTFIAVLRNFAARASATDPNVRPISEPMAMAIVGGIDVLLLAQVERGPQRRLTDLRQTASELLRAVLVRETAAAKSAAARRKAS